MDNTYWQRQTNDKPLFPDLLWSRPETRMSAGKLLIIGGNRYGFAAPADAYASAGKAGIGTLRVLLPDSLSRTVGKMFPEAEFAPVTPSGSFSQRALAELLAAAEWADGVLLAGDLGRNSETAILLEKFAADYAGQVTITKDAADLLMPAPQALLERPETLFVITLAQLQKLAIAAHFSTAITHDLDVLHFAEALHRFSTANPAILMVRHADIIFVATGGQVSSTPLQSPTESIWRVRTAARAATWWLQNPGKSYEAITSSVVNES